MMVQTASDKRLHPQSVVPTAVLKGPTLPFPTPPLSPPSPHASPRVRAQTFFNISVWLLLTGLLFGQIVGVGWTTITTTGVTLYGQPPGQGLYEIPGLNDEPYADRAVACIRSGKSYHAVQLSQLLKVAATIGISVCPTNGRDAYRVVPRDSFTMDASRVYTSHCNTLSETIDQVIAVCRTLGYNVTRGEDVLRVVHGVDSEEVIALPKALPVLILPYWDATPYARYAMPSHDGSACVFRTSGQFEDESDSTAVLWAVSRSVRLETTEAWLGSTGGAWRHGWYEDPVANMRWHAEVISSSPNSTYGIDARRFDLLDNGNEIRCTHSSALRCNGTQWKFRWNDELTAVFDMPWFTSIAISNGSRFGLFFYEDSFVLTMESNYRLERLIANVSLAVLLARWMVLLVALYPAGSIGIAALANAGSFQWMPLLLLPRLPSSLEGFWTAGSVFDGDQTAIENAWFTIYPAIGEVVLVYFSLLNLLAKLLRRRMSDALFGPTLLFFVLLHALRFELAARSWFDGNERVTGVVTADEVESASVIDYFTTALAYRIGGPVQTIFFTKLVVLGLNLLPLLGASRRTVGPEEANCLGIERALAIQSASTGGLGSTAEAVVATSASDGVTSSRVLVLRSYELVRAGYVVVGQRDAKLMTVGHWFLLAATRWPFGATSASLRVVVYDTRTTPGASSSGSVMEVSADPMVVTVGDDSLAGLSVGRLSTATFC
jgi:hypothetical protein